MFGRVAKGPSERGIGLYLGTEIDEKWWKRYTKDKLFARGNGEYWFDDQGFYFRRYLTKNVILIPFSSVWEIKLGTWHAGRWCLGISIVKIVWRKEGLRLSSGFLISKYKRDAIDLKTELEKVIGDQIIRVGKISHLKISL